MQYARYVAVGIVMIYIVIDSIVNDHSGRVGSENIAKDGIASKLDPKH